MSNTIFCKKFKEDLPALQIPPMPGARGQELMSTISQKAWDEWKSHQTTLINEKHLDMSNQEDFFQISPSFWTRQPPPNSWASPTFHRCIP